MLVDGHGPLLPAVSQFGQNTEAVGTPAIDSSLVDDVYLTVDALPVQAGGPVTIGVTVQPLVIWLWGGGVLLVLGSALAAVPGKRRRPTDPVSAPVPARNAGDGSTGSGDARGDPAVVLPEERGDVESEEPGDGGARARTGPGRVPMTTTVDQGVRSGCRHPPAAHRPMGGRCGSRRRGRSGGAARHPSAADRHRGGHTARGPERARRSPARRSPGGRSTWRHCEAAGSS